MHLRTRIISLLAAVVAATAISCSSPSGSTAAGGPKATLSIVAGESFWGSIASQLAGTAARVTSVVSDPSIDPHQYESSSDNARAFATADYVIVNGAGYDSWATKLLAGNPNPKRKVTVVAEVLGKHDGDNPHFWYQPDYVTAITDRIEADLKALDPAASGYFDAQRAAFDQASKPYRDLLAGIKAGHADAPVAATESIFVYLADYLGLRLLSPPDFMLAVAEGNDPPAAAVGTFMDLLTNKQVKVLVYNLQTATSVTSNLKKLASDQAVPTVGITETIQPATDTFEHWQATQLQQLEAALAGSR